MLAMDVHTSDFILWGFFNGVWGSQDAAQDNVFFRAVLDIKGLSKQLGVL